MSGNSSHKPTKIVYLIWISKTCKKLTLIEDKNIIKSVTRTEQHIRVLRI